LLRGVHSFPTRRSSDLACELTDPACNVSFAFSSLPGTKKEDTHLSRALCTWSKIGCGAHHAGLLVLLPSLGDFPLDAKLRSRGGDRMSGRRGNCLRCCGCRLNGGGCRGGFLCSLASGTHP